MTTPKIYIFSETYEDYKIDDYIAQGDHGPWYEVVPRQDYLDLQEQAEAMAEALEYCSAQIVLQSKDKSVFRLDSALCAIQEALAQYQAWKDKQK